MCIKQQEEPNTNLDVYIKIDKDFVGDTDLLRDSGHLSHYKTQMTNCSRNDEIEYEVNMGTPTLFTMSPYNENN